MCLAALHIDPRHRFPLVVAANRDEFHDRAAAGLSWWSPDGAGPVLAGRDLRGGGTWLGLSPDGRMALVTNVRGSGGNDASAPSRGGIVPLWLMGSLDAGEFWARVSSAGHNAFNVVMGDFASGACFWAASGMASPHRLGPGLFGLSNAALDTPWPKVTALKARVRDALTAAGTPMDLADRLFDALADETPAPDDALPSTGVPLALERALSPAFIRLPDRGYGTRCSTLLITERDGDRLVTHVLERSFAPGDAVQQRQARLDGWPAPAGTAFDPAAASVSRQSVRTISTWGMPASSNAGPRSTKPARE